jgi:hypothetical protein
VDIFWILGAFGLKKITQKIEFLLQRKWPCPKVEFEYYAWLNPLKIDEMLILLTKIMGRIFGK